MALIVSLAASRETLLQDAREACCNSQCEEAVRSLEAAVRLQPSDFELHYHLGACQSGGCRQHSLTNPDIAVAHLRHALSLLGESGNPSARARILDTLGNTYVHSRQLSRVGHLKAALECHQSAASIYRSMNAMDDWARLEFNLGNTWCELPEAECPDKWVEAIAHYERALQIRTRQSGAERHAATLQNLGTAYRELPTGDRAASIRRAIQCYRQALRIYRAATSPVRNAALHNNLGTAYLSLPVTDRETGRRNALRALRHLDRALLVRTRSAYPCDYAITQFNCGQAFSLLISAGSETSQAMAGACLKEARACFLLCGQTEYAEMVDRQLVKA